MRRLFGLFVLLVFLLSGFIFVTGSGMPPFPGESSSEPEVVETSEDISDDASSEAEQLQKDIDDNIPIDPETGEFDVSKVDGVKLKAQERIDEINGWLEENAAWLKFVLRMNPAISWTFFVMLYILLFFFTVLVLNGDEFFFTMTKPAAAYGSGLAIFAILLVTSVYVNLAKFVVKVFDLIFNTIVPYGIIAIVILFVIFIIALIVFPQLVSLMATLPGKIFKGNGIRRHQKELASAVGETKDIRDEIGAFRDGMNE